MLPTANAAETEAVARMLELVEGRLRSVAGDAPSPVGEAALHLVSAGGKRVRPRVLLHAARVGGGPLRVDTVVDLAVAAELVHNASLLHDDVIDEADLRRGRPSARAAWGNAHAVLAGDHLMAGAFELLERAAVPTALASMIATIRRLVAAEVVQLAHRGRLLPDLDHYYRVVRGKTAALFAWCADAGARAGAADEDVCRALTEYGEELGVAFQLWDDLLDIEGTAEELGKSLLTDLEQGVGTLPVILAAEVRPELARALVEAGAEASRRGGGGLEGLVPRVRRWVDETGAAERTRALAEEHVARARASLVPLGELPERGVLEGLALRMVRRRS